VVERDGSSARAVRRGHSAAAAQRPQRRPSSRPCHPVQRQRAAQADTQKGGRRGLARLCLRCRRGGLGRNSACSAHPRPPAGARRLRGRSCQRLHEGVRRGASAGWDARSSAPARALSAQRRRPLQLLSALRRADGALQPHPEQPGGLQSCPWQPQQAWQCQPPRALSTPSLQGRTPAGLLQSAQRQSGGWRPSGEQSTVLLRVCAATLLACVNTGDEKPCGAHGDGRGRRCVVITN
jgi:hypothetical protein